MLTKTICGIVRKLYVEKIKIKSNQLLQGLNKKV
jgi:hypothetical protein